MSSVKKTPVIISKEALVSKAPAPSVSVNPFISEIQAVQQDRAHLKQEIKVLSESTPGVEALETLISADTALIETLKHNGVVPPTSSASGEGKQLAAEVNKVNDILNHPVVAPVPSAAQVSRDAAEEQKALALEAANKRLLRDELAREAAAGITLQHGKASSSEKAAEAAAQSAELAALVASVPPSSTLSVIHPTPADVLLTTAVAAVVPVPQGVTLGNQGSLGTPAIEAVYYYQSSNGPVTATLVSPFVPANPLASPPTSATSAAYSVTIDGVTYGATYHGLLGEDGHQGTYTIPISHVYTAQRTSANGVSPATYSVTINGNDYPAVLGNPASTAAPATYSVNIYGVSYPATYTQAIGDDTNTAGTYTFTIPFSPLVQQSAYVPAVVVNPALTGSILPNVGTNYATPLSNYWFAHYHNATRRVTDINTSTDNQLVIDSGAGLQFVPRAQQKTSSNTGAVRPAPLDHGFVLGPQLLTFDPIISGSTNVYGVNVIPPQSVFRGPGQSEAVPVQQVFKVDETEIAVLHPGVYKVAYEVYTHSPDARFGLFVKAWVDPSTLPGPGIKVDPSLPKPGAPVLVDGSVGYFHNGSVRGEVLVECRTFDELILVNMGKEAIRLDNFSLYGRPNATLIIHNITPVGVTAPPPTPTPL